MYPYFLYRDLLDSKISKEGKTAILPPLEFVPGAMIHLGNLRNPSMLLSFLLCSPVYHSERAK